MISIEVPDDVIPFVIEVASLPDKWEQFPALSALGAFGDTFIVENKHLALNVPSAVVQGERNILLNPRHVDFPKVKIVEEEPFVFDPRLVK